jgi:cell division protein FtsB
MLSLAVLTGLITLYSGDGYPRLNMLRRSISGQHSRNRDLEMRVAEPKQQVEALQLDERALEKVARDQYGLARPDELVFIFDGNEPGTDRVESAAAGESSGKGTNP